MSHSSICYCPAFQTGYIQAEDKHGCCRACLGSKHALMVLSSPDACPFCANFRWKRQRRADAATALVDDNDLTFSQDVYSFEEALDFFYLARGPELDDPAPSMHA